MGRDLWLLVASGLMATLAVATTLGGSYDRVWRSNNADATGDGIKMWRTAPVGIPCSEPTPCPPPENAEDER